MSRKTLNIITIVLFVVSVIVAIFTFANINTIGEIQDGAYANSGLVNPLLFWTYLLLGITLVLVLFLPLPSIIKNPKALKRTLFVVVGIIVAFGIVYALSQGSPDGETIWNTLLPKQQDEYKADFLVANMNIIGAEIALIGAVVVILWSMLKGYVKK
ncbi:MAG: hypothetical protein LBC68_15405 [Prevotellaceae bacterium]|jgi:hypothetical protein|nr:hypothetical protein [Prevotellaceae bacterium]